MLNLPAVEKIGKKLEVKNGKYQYHYLTYQFTKRSKKVCLIDCGSRFNPFLITNAAKLEKIDPEKLLKLIKISRVFTVFQLKTAVEKCLSDNPDVLIISDIDQLVKDQSISDIEKENALTSAVVVISKLHIPVFVVGNNFMFTNLSMDN